MRIATVKYDKDGNRILNLKDKNKKAVEIYSCKEELKRLLMTAFGVDKTWNDVIEKSIRKGFIEAVSFDKKRERIKIYAPKAIENQNTVIQPKDNGERGIFFQLSASDKEKRALNRFLFQYANLDEEKRHEMRLRMRRILVLYFYDEKEAESVENEWLDHEKRRDNDAQFASDIDILFDDDKKKEEKGQYRGKKYKIRNDAMRKRNIKRYRESIKITDVDEKGLYFEDNEVNHFWIHHIENSVERIYLNHLKPYKTKKGYLGEKVWKDMLNLLSIKYIALGKSVYHFGMGEDVKSCDHFGKVSPKWEDGITSFEYERIKSEETLQRDLAIYVAFAASHLSSATVDVEKAVADQENKPKNERKSMEDFLLWTEEDITNYNKGDIQGGILQFFGGKSTWGRFLLTKVT